MKFVYIIFHPILTPLPPPPSPLPPLSLALCFSRTDSAYLVHEAVKRFDNPRTSFEISVRSIDQSIICDHQRLFFLTYCYLTYCCLTYCCLTCCCMLRQPCEDILQPANQSKTLGKAFFSLYNACSATFQSQRVSKERCMYLLIHRQPILYLMSDVVFNSASNQRRVVGRFTTEGYVWGTECGQLITGLSDPRQMGERRESEGNEHAMKLNVSFL